MHNPSVRPDWATWSALSKVKVWQGVALSLDSEPTSIPTKDLETARRLETWAHLGGFQGSPYLPITASALLLDYRIARDFNQRVAAVMIELDALQPHPKEGDDKPNADCYVNLPKLAAWAVRLGWSVPPEFAALAQSAARDQLTAEHARQEARRAAERYTLEDAAKILAADVTKISKDRWLDRMMADVRDGKLRLRNPQNPADRLPYRIPQAIREYDERMNDRSLKKARAFARVEETDAIRLNQWLDANPEDVVAHPATEAMRTSVARVFRVVVMIETFLESDCQVYRDAPLGKPAQSEACVPKSLNVAPRFYRLLIC